MGGEFSRFSGSRVLGSRVLGSGVLGSRVLGSRFSVLGSRFSVLGSRFSNTDTASRDERDDDIWPVGNQRVDVPGEQAAGVVFAVDGPDLDAESRGMGVVDKARRHDSRRA